jgi:fucose 4-O-acetylase-like acetyltransferase
MHCVGFFNKEDSKESFFTKRFIKLVKPFSIWTLIGGMVIGVISIDINDKSFNNVTWNGTLLEFVKAC